MVTVVVSTIGIIKANRVISIGFSTKPVATFVVGFQINNMLNAASNAPKNCEPLSPIYILEGDQLNRKKPRIDAKTTTIPNINGNLV